ncbi:MAG: hypothetical protein IJL06_06865, partial [Kiritimatiellae bacterium]|nr:hypothetical protein [Kiritimatiellia bacterium]
MASLLWTSVVFALAAAFSAASLCLWLRERGIRPVRRVAAFLSRHTTPGRVLLGALFVVMWMFASVKPNGGSRGAVTPADEWEGFVPITSTNTTRTLDGDDFRRGFVLTRVGTNETHNFAASSNAVVCADWLTFGAAEDWVYENVEWRMENGERGTGTCLRVHSDGWVELKDGPVFCPFKAALGIVPEANWGPLAETTTPSLFWHALTPSGSLVLTWRNALFGRDADAPVSVQMEAWPGGRFVYRYDFSRLGAAVVSNFAAGAALGGVPWATNALPPNVTSLEFHALLPEDAANHDRDGDGLSLLDELFFYDTDPRRPDTDFDGVSDGGEVAAGTDPLLRDTDGDGFADGTDVRPLEADAWADADGDGLPDAWKDGWFGTDAVVAADADANADGISNLAALLMGVNPLAPCVDGFSRPGSAGVTTAWEISPVAFSFSRPDGLTNLVRRTFAVERESPWEQFFVSSRPDGADGWEMADAALFYGLDGGPATNAAPSSSGDSWRVPLCAAMPQTITFRLEATGGAPSLSAPLYLVRWAPSVEFLPSANVTVVAATNGHVYAAAKRDPGTGAYGIPFRVDMSGIPCRAGAGCGVASDLALSPADGVAVSNGMFTAEDPLMADLPRGGTGPSKRLLFYDVGVGRVGAVSSGPRASRFSSPYPLTSSALRRAFHVATGVTADGSVALSLSPNVPELGYVAVSTGGPRLRGTVAGGSVTGSFRPPATVTPTVCGEPCTNDVHEVVVVYPEDHDGTHPEDDEDDGGCGCCGDGGSSIGSFRIRIPFGEPAEGEHLGFLWAVVDGPTAITPSVFRVLAAQGVSAVTNADGTLSVSCAAAGGKTLMVTNTAHGVAVPVWNASGRFESQWEVWNEGGDESRIRVRRTTVLGNATVDETYATWTDWAPEIFGDARGPATVWERTDNILGVSTRRHEWRGVRDPGFVGEEYEETRAGGEAVRAEQRVYEAIGGGEAARRRLSRACGYDELGWYETVRTYWCDTDHPDRHARLRSETSDRRPWSWHDYDDAGRETVRVEQLDGSPFPELAEVSPGAWMPPECSAKVTVMGYEPREGDDAHRNDSFEPREVSVYIRRGSEPPVMVSHEVRVY